MHQALAAIKLIVFRYAVPCALFGGGDAPDRDEASKARRSLTHPHRGIFLYDAVRLRSSKPRYQCIVAVRAELVEAGACSLIGLHACAKGGCRDVPPAGHLLFLRRQEKKAKEGDPTVCVPALRFGQPAVLASSGVSLELAALRQSRALIRWPLCSSAHSEGWGSRAAIRAFAALGPGGVSWRLVWPGPFLPTS